jgi:hypothetical protein
LKLENCDGLDVKKEIKELFIHHFREKLRVEKSCTIDVAPTNDELQETSKNI